MDADPALAARGNYADIYRESIDDFGGIVARSRGTVQLRTNWSLSAAETGVLSSRWIHEVRAQFAYENLKVNALDPVCGGPCMGIDQGGPTVDLTGVAAVGRQRTSPQLRLSRRVQLLDTVSYFTGPHHFKAGGEFNHLAFPSRRNVLPGYFGGRYIFSAIPPLGVGSALDGLQGGIPAAYVQGYGNPLVPDARYRDLSLFTQDEWRRDRFLMRAGVRYQLQLWKGYTIRVSDVGGGTVSYPSPTGGNDIAPRIGISYDVTGRGRTIVHSMSGLLADEVGHDRVWIGLTIASVVMGTYFWRRRGELAAESTVLAQRPVPSTQRI